MTGGSGERIEAWLASLGLSELVGRFADNDIDVSVLPELTDQDLKEIGISLGHRRKLLRAIADRAAEPAPGAADAAMPAAPRREDTGERRHLTVMFCDLVGSTALAARLDPEDMREVVRAYQGACAQVIARYEGFVAQYLGDGVMAYFGYPQAHEDDAERAVRAGLDLIAVAAKLDTKAKIEVRIGIATGLVVVGDLIGEQGARERAVTGETPNLAARLQGLATPGTVVVSAATRRLLGGMFDLRDLGPQQVKGLAEPIGAFAVAAARSFESRFEARTGGLTGFIGREEECEHLLARWKLARQGRGQAVLVSGEAGIGKSRLTAWLVDKVSAEPHTRMRYQCTPHHRNSALYPTIAQIERAAGIAANEAGEAKLAKLEALLTLGQAEATETVPLFAALLAIPLGEKYRPLAMSPGQQRQRTFAALTDQVEALARQKPLLMIYEDAHWADATSLELLDALVDRLARSPVLFVVTSRPEFSPAWAGRHNVSTVTLQKLDKRHTRAMVESVTGGAALPPDVLDQIVAKTDGVPLFVEELTKTVLESGALAEEGGKLKATAALPIPETLQDSLMARLDRSNPVKEIAQIGAAIGREFSYRLLAAVAGMDEASVRAGLAKLEEAELATRRGLPPDATYTFKHALVQDAAYESLLKSRRQLIHRRIAKSLRDRFALVAETEPEVIAHHFTQAARNEQAAAWWTKAGERAMRRSAHREAASSFQKAIEIADVIIDDPSRLDFRVRLQLAYCSVLLPLYGYGASETAAGYARCDELARRGSNPLHRLASAFGVWSCHICRFEILSSKQIALESLEDPVIGSIPEGARAHYMLGMSLWCLGQYMDATPRLRHWLAVIKQTSDVGNTSIFASDAHVTTRVFLAFNLWALGDIDDALSHMQAAVSHAMSAGQAHSIAYALTFGAYLAAMRRHSEQVIWHTNALEEICCKFDLLMWSPHVSVLRCWLQRSEPHQMLCDPVALEHQGVASPQMYGILAEARSRNDIEVGLRTLEAALEQTAWTKLRWYDAELHRLRGMLLLQSAKDKAGSAFASAIQVARVQQTRTFELRASLDLARLYCNTGREREAVPLLQDALAGFIETLELPEIGEAQRLLASLDGELPQREQL